MNPMKNQRKIGPPLSKSILAEEFLDFLIGLGELVFTEFHQGFGTFQLLGELINIEFIILILSTISSSSLTACSYFISSFSIFLFCFGVTELTVDILKLLPLQGVLLIAIIPRAMPWAKSFWAFSPYLNHMQNFNKL